MPSCSRECLKNSATQFKVSYDRFWLKTALTIFTELPNDDFITKVVIAWWRFAGTRYSPIKPGQISPCDFMRKSYLIQARCDSFPPGICLYFSIFFKPAWAALQNYMGRFRRVKAGSRQYKRRILSCRNEAFHMKLQDTIYEEFVILLGSRQNGTEFHTGQAGSCNQYLKSSILAPCYRYTYWPYFF